MARFRWRSDSRAAISSDTCDRRLCAASSICMPVAHHKDTGSAESSFSRNTNSRSDGGMTESGSSRSRLSRTEIPTNDGRVPSDSGREVRALCERSRRSSDGRCEAIASGMLSSALLASSSDLSADRSTNKSSGRLVRQLLLNDRRASLWKPRKTPGAIEDRQLRSRSSVVKVAATDASPAGSSVRRLLMRSSRARRTHRLQSAGKVVMRLPVSNSSSSCASSSSDAGSSVSWL